MSPFALAPRRSLLYICIPVHDEAPTIGVLLWRIRKLFQSFPREYELVVYDDGSTDATREVLQPYADVLPLTLLGDGTHRGYAHAVDALCRAVVERTRYPRRDAMILMQGDFTDQPDDLPELVKRFEGGADIVVAERVAPTTQRDRTPTPVRWMRRVAPWTLRPFVTVNGVNDPFGSYRLIRITLIRDAIRHVGEAPVVQGAVWAANVDLLLRTVPLARRVETVQVDARYDLRPRESRIHPWSDALDLLRFGRARRGVVLPRQRGAPEAAR